MPSRLSWLQEKDEFVENIIADIQRLGLRFEKISYTSDYFPQLKECGERMIKAGGCLAACCMRVWPRPPRLPGSCCWWRAPLAWATNVCSQAWEGPMFVCSV